MILEACPCCRSEVYAEYDEDGTPTYELPIARLLLRAARAAH